MKKRFVIQIFLFLFSVAPSMVTANEKPEHEFDCKIDIVSQNVWRGCYQAGASIQPEAVVSSGRWEFSIWGTTDLLVVEKEIDVAVKYSSGDFTFVVTDYWFDGATAPYGSGHIPEAGVLYSFPSIPVSMSFSSAVYGDGGKFSSYAEIIFNQRLNEFNLELSAGLCPWENIMLETGKFAVTCLSAELRKRTVTCSEFAIEAVTKAVYNPNKDNAFWIAGISIVF
jgi:hypothetical protein